MNKQPNEISQKEILNNNVELQQEMTNTANELVDEAKEIAAEFTEDLKNLPNEIKDAVKEEVLEEFNEVKEELVEGVKETFQDLVNSIFGDFQAFITLFKFSGMWFIKPLSYNVREMKQKASKSAIDAQKYFTDVKLMKAMFIFSLLFLAAETTYEAGTEGAEEDALISQAVFLLFYLAFIIVYLGFGWVWQKSIGLKLNDSRKFIGYLVYEYAAVYFLQFITVAILGLDIENDTLGMSLALFVPFAHMMYFFFRLMRHYEVKGMKVLIGLTLAAVFASGFLLITAAMSHVVVVDGI